MFRLLSSTLVFFTLFVSVISQTVTYCIQLNCKVGRRHMDKSRALLLRLGIRSTLKGFYFLLYALKLCLSNDEYLLSVYKTLYVDVATHFGTSRDNVEHCIRTAISNCWYKGNRKLLINITGYELKQKPANGEFIDILYNHLTQEG